MTPRPGIPRPPCLGRLEGDAQCSLVAGVSRGGDAAGILQGEILKTHGADLSLGAARATRALRRAISSSHLSALTFAP